MLQRAVAVAEHMVVHNATCSRSPEVQDDDRKRVKGRKFSYVVVGLDYT